MRPVAPRHQSPLARHLGGRPRAGFHGVRVEWQATTGAWAARARPWQRRLERGRAQEYLEVGGDPQGVGQLGAMQRTPERGIVAELRIAHHGGEEKPRGPHLAQQRQGQAPFRRERHRRRNLGARPLPRCQPLLGQIQRRAQQPRPRPGPQGDRDGGLAVRDLAPRAAVLARDPHGGRALFRETRPVEHQDPGALRQLRAQPFPQRLGVPRRMRDEMLEGLIGARIAEPRPHRFHRFAPTVAQQAGHIPTQRAALTLPTEVAFEPLQPDQQAFQPRTRGVIQHRAAAYRNRVKSTMTSKVITREFPREIVNLTK